MRKDEMKIEHVLDQALELEKRGVSVQEILKHFPEHRAELAELLGAAGILRSEGKRIVPRAEFAERALGAPAAPEPIRSALASFRRLVIRTLIAVPAGVAVILFILIAYSQTKSPVLPAIPTVEELTREAANLEHDSGTSGAAGLTGEKRDTLGLEPELPPSGGTPPEAGPTPSSPPEPSPSGAPSAAPLFTRNIVVSEPIPNQEIDLPLTIRGQARVFENSVQYRVKDAKGRVLVEGISTAQATDVNQFGPFEVKTSYPKPFGERGVIEVFSESLKDGSETNQVEVPVRFKEIETFTVAAFFPKHERADAADCRGVFALERRVPRTAEIARAAIEELLRGPTLDEAKRGYFTNLNSGVRLQKLTIKDGVAAADFDETLELGVDGSCRATSIRSQIEATLKQFPTVKAVEISVSGRTENIFQP